MTSVTPPPTLWLLHWSRTGPHPRLTLLAVDGADATRAEETAAACFVRTGVPASWLGADAATRREVVRGCRTVPALGMVHLEDDEPGRAAAESLRLSLTQAAGECPRSPRPEVFRAREQGVLVALSTVPAGLLPEAERVARSVLDSPPAVFAGPGEWPALRALTALTAVVCQETETLELPEGEDLLDIYDQYSVGGLGTDFLSGE
ncbi:hypothetical protein [Streptomyces sp. MST-110588]|uniref:hypothetical protein n=1 Tax=Streptomyces sp. MST-110588 TaxID=2833628 RepID=UPI001F5D62F8|nr:hypothetical protein [Streptomyces sp. MST-110588]UNO40058.1 hypothetical protein KGS77_11235 [Streptomyces sp. MST-110588]